MMSGDMHSIHNYYGNNGGSAYPSDGSRHQINNININYQRVSPPLLKLPQQ